MFPDINEIWRDRPIAGETFASFALNLFARPGTSRGARVATSQFYLKENLFFIRFLLQKTLLVARIGFNNLFFINLDSTLKGETTTDEMNGADANCLIFQFYIFVSALINGLAIVVDDRRGFLLDF